jgi:hypothetical protein
MDELGAGSAKEQTLLVSALEALLALRTWAGVLNKLSRAKECDLYHTLHVPGWLDFIGMSPLRSVKIIVQRLQKSESSAASFKLVAYDVDTTSVYRPMQFRSAEELLQVMNPMTAELVEALKSVQSRPGATIVFDQVLQISEAQLYVLDSMGRQSEWS